MAAIAAQQQAETVAAKKEELVAWLEKNGGKEDGVLEEDVKAHFGDSKVLGQAVNSLSQTERLAIESSNGSLVYKLKERVIQEPSVLTNEQIIVLQVVRGAGNSGVWLRDIKNATSLQQQTLNKALKVLETRKLVKTVKSVQQKTKKLYMAFELEPTRDVSGGPWYTDQEFDTEFVTEVKKVILKYIQQKQVQQKEAVSFSDIDTMLKQLKAFKVTLEPHDVKLVIDSLIFDRKIEQFYTTSFDDASIKYKLAKDTSSLLPFGSSGTTQTSVFHNLPCGTCPVRDRCSEHGIISPNSCIYLDRWFYKDDLSTSALDISASTRNLFSSPTGHAGSDTADRKNIHSSLLTF